MTEFPTNMTIEIEKTLNNLFKEKTVSYDKYKNVLDEYSKYSADTEKQKHTADTIKAYARQYSQSLYHKFIGLSEARYKLFNGVLNKSASIIGEKGKDNKYSGGEYSKLIAQEKYLEALGLMYGAIKYADGADASFRQIIDNLPPATSGGTSSTGGGTPSTGGGTTGSGGGTPSTGGGTPSTGGTGGTNPTNPPGDTPPAKIGRKYVLMVGINDYVDEAVTDLDCCENDANGLNQCLGSKWKDAKKEILLSRAATKKEIRKWFENLQKENLQPEDEVLFMFSGHGTNDGKNGYLCPADLNTNDSDVFENSLISGKELADWRKGLGSATTIFVIDSCFSGRIISNFKAADGKRGKIKFLPMKLSKSNFNQDEFRKKIADSGSAEKSVKPANPTIILTASSGTQNSEEDRSFIAEGVKDEHGKQMVGQGVFIGWLERALGAGDNMGKADKDKDQDVSIKEGFEHSEKGIKDDGYEQSPQLYCPPGYSDWNIKGINEKAEADVSPQIADRERDYVRLEKKHKPKKVNEGEKPVKTGKIFVLSIGINNYSDYGGGYGTPPELNFCVDDAEDMGEALQSSICPPENVKVLKNDQATWTNVRAQVEAIKAKMGPDDKFIFYFSGHGTNDNGDGRICLYDQMVSGKQLGDDLRDKVGSNEVVFIFDSCQIGAMIGKGALAKKENAVKAEGVKYFKHRRSRDNFKKAQYKMVESLVISKGGIARPNTFVFTSCRGDEYSIESSDFGGGHGAFTSALLQVLTEKRTNGSYIADYIRDNNLSMLEIVGGALVRTKIITRDKETKRASQHPQYVYDNNVIIK